MNDYDVPETPAEFKAKVQHWQGLTIIYNALRQGQRYSERRTWCRNCGRYRGRIDQRGQCLICAAWWKANPPPGPA